MEYIRKQRWATYSSAKCKEYLRNDFAHECAYCKLQEKEVGIVGLNFFEIDHFKPQVLKLSDSHKYHNLYYCCKKCNKEKSDIWDTNLLDPCTDDIFSGNTPAIAGGKEKDNYKYIAQNDRGTFYINTFKLNSITQIHFRRAREAHEHNLRVINSLIDEILPKVQDNVELRDFAKSVFQLVELIRKKPQELDVLPKNEMFEEVEEYLNDKDIENILVFEEYNMDIQMKFNGNTYYCELVLDNSIEEKAEYRKNIDIEKLTTWFEKLNCNFGILFYYPKIKRMYFYPVSDEIKLSETAGTNKLKQIKISAKHLIS